MLASVAWRAIDLVLERPTLVMGVIAAIIGGVLGSWIAAHRRLDSLRYVQRAPSKLAAATARKRGAGIGSAFGLVAALTRLLMNPIAQHFLRRAIAKQISRRLSF